MQILSGIHSNYKENSTDTTVQIFAPTCGSEKTSCILFIGPYGKVAPSKTVNHSARVFSPILHDVNSINRKSRTDVLFNCRGCQLRIIGDKIGIWNKFSSHFVASQGHNNVLQRPWSLEHLMKCTVLIVQQPFSYYSTIFQYWMVCKLGWQINVAHLMQNFPGQSSWPLCPYIAPPLY